MVNQTLGRVRRIAVVVSAVLLAAGAVIAAPPLTQAASADSGFTDVPSGAPFEAEITWLVEEGITTGFEDGTYKPTAPVTRQSIAAFLYRSAGSPDGDEPTCSTQPFDDIPLDHPFCGEIAWLVDAGYANGFPDGTYRPTNPVTRQSIAAFLYRIAGAPNGGDPSCSAQSFSDVPVSHQFCGEIDWMVQEGITDGYPDDTFRPTNPVTRQSIAAFLSRMRTLATDVAVGDRHACSLMDDQTVWCWGQNADGQVGDGSIVTRTEPVQVLDGVSDLAAGSKNTCAVVTGDGVYCWGDNSQGQVGDATYVDKLVPTKVSGSLSTAVQVSVGQYGACARLANGTLRCWGISQDGALGDNGVGSGATPVAVSGISDAVDVSVGSIFACAVKATGVVRCWGNNLHGQIGDGTSNNSRLTSVAVSGISTAATVSAGEQHTCAVLTDATVKCWGSNSNGQLGDGTSGTDRLTPVAVIGLTDALSVESSMTYTCATRSAGATSCWGYNAAGQFGTGDIGGNVLTPELSDIANASKLSSVWATTCAVAGGDVWCFGRGAEGLFNDGTTDDHPAPYRIRHLG